MNKNYKKMVVAALVCAVAMVTNANPYVYPVRYVPVTKVVAVHNEYTNPWRGAARTTTGWVGAPAVGNLRQARTVYRNYRPRTIQNYRVPVVGR